MEQLSEKLIKHTVHFDGTITEYKKPEIKQLGHEMKETAKKIAFENYINKLEEIKKMNLI